MLSLISWNAQGQSTTVFFDDFASSGNLTKYTSVSTINPTDFQISSGTLRISNGIATAPGNGGKTYLTDSLSGYHPLFKPILKNNTADITWTFNSRTAKSGMNSFVIGQSNHAVAVVLAATNSDLTAQDTEGYAVVFNQGNFKVQLVKFSQGFDSDEGITSIIGPSTENINTSYASYKVVYSPGTDTWSLFYRNDGTAFKDPAVEGEDAMTQVGASVVDNTYTSTKMTVFGFLYNHGGISNANNTRVMFDNYKVVIATEALGIDASLSDLKVSLGGENYVTLTLFDSAVKNYQYYLKKNHALPLVSAVTNDENAGSAIVQAVNLKGTKNERTAVITVTAEDTEISEVYTIEFIETDNIYQCGMGDANGTTAGGGGAAFVPEGWSHSNMYFSGDLTAGNNKFEGPACVRLGTTATLATLTLPPMTSIGTLKFFAKKYEEGVVGTVKVLTQKDGESWALVKDFGDISNLTYQEFEVVINETANEPLLVRIEVTKNGDTFTSRGYYFDDFSYTAFDPGTGLKKEINGFYKLHRIQKGFAVDVESAEVEIYNSKGILQQSASVQGTHNFSINQPGIYIIRISGTQGDYTTKYLIK